MQINADLSKRAVVNSGELPWVDSPMAGVQRRMLDRDGAEVARATSLVRYAPDSWFSEHSHDAGEEFLVLEGVFSDEMGDFPAGMYVRNPIGSRHTPHTVAGTVILVKLRQFEAEDQAFVRIDTNNTEWLQGLAEGIECMPLHHYKSERVMLLKWRAGTRFRNHAHPGGEEMFVLRGSLSDEQGHYPAGTWLRNPPGSKHNPYSEEGCLVFLKCGHLG
jgi:anti-sigma factor ChrR (cupin superfamily)